MRGGTNYELRITNYELEYFLSSAVVAMAVRVLEKGTAWVFRAASLLLLLTVHEFSPARVLETLRKGSSSRFINTNQY